MSPNDAVAHPWELVLRGKPPGWATNPSSPAQRVPIVVLALIGLAIALSFMLRERGMIERLWEPARVRTSTGFPGPVVGAPWPELDAIAFAVVLALTTLGNATRWRSRSALAVGAGVAVLVTAVSSVARFTLQYVSQQATSTLFVASTIAAVAMVPLAVDELYAASVHGRDVRRGVAQPTYEGPHHSHVGSLATHWTGYVAGATGIAVGAMLLLASATTLGIGAAHHARLVGGTVAAVGALSMAQVARPARWINAALGLGLVLAPLAAPYGMFSAVQMVLLGLVLTIASAILGDPTTQSSAVSDQ